MTKAICVTLLALAAAWPAGATTTAPAPPAGNKLYLVAHAVGVQIYTCTASGWTLAGPRADLYGANGKLVATHFAGPTWRATDGSTFVGRAIDKVTVDPTAIPWLLLERVSSAPGEGDRLAETTYVQRLNTTGGLAPARACATGDTAEITYTADYAFWKASGPDKENA
jgi:hypothetical protein